MRSSLAAILCCICILVASSAALAPTVAVLGATGYVGSSVVSLLESRGVSVLKLSRSSKGPNSLAIDFTKPDAPDIFQNYLESNNLTITKYVHCVGCLFDTSVPFNSELNKLASGSSTTVSSTYDEITFQTTSNLVNAISSQKLPSKVVFISAAEVGWPSVKFGPQIESLSPSFLKRYLLAKRKAEEALKTSPYITATILRPSIIYTEDALDSKLTVDFFNAFSRTRGIVKLPFVDEPVSVGVLAEAVAEGLENEEGGIWRKEDMIKRIK
ncbi:hypothetical protein TrST_g10477 [Triparma strigata]|uniref:NAD-dependent epimerase/dehydratase domain-containing protein n=1 Tax=Triparma strigata TaxID=1606541 RepID=A0A9W7ANU7_9STRA|nr:hypothetical protein TrST_g10477 [Triparma strigata]